MFQSKPKKLSRLLSALGAAVLSVALFAPAAQGADPAPGYEQFRGCPSPEENPEIAGCLRSVITGGHFQMGSKTVPISSPITLRGGFVAGLKDFSYNEEGGLEKVKLPVPGGLVGLTGLDWLVNLLSAEQLKLYAVTELAGTPIFGTNFSNLSVSLPIKVRLVNPQLSSNCRIGSNSNPIQLNLQVGTTNPPPPNQPITGTQPEFSVDEESGIISLLNGTFVDNAFAAPGASGCFLTLLGLPTLNINALVNTQAGLPSPAGTNETIQDFDIELVESVFVYP
jgi:hypothetical protein